MRLLLLFLHFPIFPHSFYLAGAYSEFYVGGRVSSLFHDIWWEGTKERHMNPPKQKENAFDDDDPSDFPHLIAASLTFRRSGATAAASCFV